MKHVVVELEMNIIQQKSKAREICRMETIEIGAVMLDEDFREISSFRTYVKPEYNGKIVKKITRLTGITDAMIVNAPTFNEALRMFTNWCLGTSDAITIHAWSRTDHGQITREMQLKDYAMEAEERDLLENEWLDFQQEFDSCLGFDRQLSLQMALNMAGIDFAGRKHDALDDARNTAVLLQISRDEKRFAQTLKKIKEVMEPKKIGVTMGDLFDFAGVEWA